MRIDTEGRRIGLSMKSDGGEDTDFELPDEYKTESSLKVGQNIVGLASAFDEAFATGGEEWSPGDDPAKKDGSEEESK